MSGDLVPVERGKTGVLVADPHPHRGDWEPVYDVVRGPGVYRCRVCGVMGYKLIRAAFGLAAGTIKPYEPGTEAGWVVERERETQRERAVIAAQRERERMKRQGPDPTA